MMADANTRSAIQITTQLPPDQKELLRQLVLPWANSWGKTWVPQLDTIRPQNRVVHALSTWVG